jgi:hypothetical protein
MLAGYQVARMPIGAIAANTGYPFEIPYPIR